MTSKNKSNVTEKKQHCFVFVLFFLSFSCLTNKIQVWRLKNTLNENCFAVCKLCLTHSHTQTHTPAKQCKQCQSPQSHTPVLTPGNNWGTLTCACHSHGNSCLPPQFIVWNQIGFYVIKRNPLTLTGAQTTYFMKGTPPGCKTCLKRIASPLVTISYEWISV